MSGRPGGKSNKVLFPPVNFIFSRLMKKVPVLVWLYEQPDVKIEGTLLGFDEFMNLVLDNAVEVREKTDVVDGSRKNLGQILLKGDNVSLMQDLNP